MQNLCLEMWLEYGVLEFTRYWKYSWLIFQFTILRFPGWSSPPSPCSQPPWCTRRGSGGHRARGRNWQCRPDLVIMSHWDWDCLPLVILRPGTISCPGHCSTPGDPHCPHCTRCDHPHLHTASSAGWRSLPPPAKRLGFVQQLSSS